VSEVARAARDAPRAPGAPGASDLLLDGLAQWHADECATGAPLVKDALKAFRDPDLTDDEELRWLWFACRAALDLWDMDSLRALSARQVHLALEVGALTTLPFALSIRSVTHVLSGELAESAALEEELHEAVVATGSAPVPFSGLWLAAWQGRSYPRRDESIEDAGRRGEGIALAVGGATKALLLNSHGRYEEAFAAAEEAAGHPPSEGFVTWTALVELIEAASYLKRPEKVHGPLARIDRVSGVSGTDWALGLAARCRALCAEGDDVEPAYAEAILCLGRTPARGEFARTSLLYGEWLRRERRRGEAQQHLRVAHDVFTAMGAEVFAARAARELRATGAQARKRTTGACADLTAQEAQVARLVREGFTNSEIAVRLFLSPRTVEWHLSKIFAKLHVTSRRQLISRREP